MEANTYQEIQGLARLTVGQLREEYLDVFGEETRSRRLADRTARGGAIDTVRFKDHLKLCRGQMAALLASRRDPETILALKGNKPLELRFHAQHRAVL